MPKPATHSGTTSQPTAFEGRNARAPMPPPIRPQPATTLVSAWPRTRTPASAEMGTSVTASAAESGRIAQPTTSNSTTPKRSALRAPETSPSARIGRSTGRRIGSVGGRASDHVFRSTATRSGMGACATKIERHENACVRAPPSTVVCRSTSRFGRASVTIVASAKTSDAARTIGRSFRLIREEYARARRSCRSRRCDFRPAPCSCQFSPCCSSAERRPPMLTRSESSNAVVAKRPALAPPLDTFTFVGGGDIALTGSADARVFAGIRRFLLHADLVVGNLEGTLATGGAPKCAGEFWCFTFRGSPAWAATLRGAGFMVLNVANNHALDYGTEAQRETLTALRRARILHQGLPGKITYVRAGRVKVALIGCAPYRWSQSLLDVRSTERLVRRAARHADVVLVYMHAGAEGTGAEHVRDGDESYLGESRGNARAFAHAMVKAGADLVFGSGPHVVRGIEWYRGRLIAYSLGNLAGTHTLSTQGALGESALLSVTLDADGRLQNGSVVPLRLVGRGTPLFDARGGTILRIRGLSHADFGARAIRIAASGRIAAPRCPQTCSMSLSR